jgi:hypothetical protein
LPKKFAASKMTDHDNLRGKPAESSNSADVCSNLVLLRDQM